MNLFMGLGFQKCATTWLSIRLRKHPELYVPPVNELRYWNNYEKKSRMMPLQEHYPANWSRRMLATKKRKEMCAMIDRMDFWRTYISTTPDGVESYMRLFEAGKDATASGEICPGYVGLSGETLALIEKAVAPKVFIIMREPIARIWSQIRHEARLRPENVSTPEKMESQLSTHAYRIQCDYVATIQRMRKVFPEDRLGFFFFEDMLESEKKFLKSVCEFIGVPFERKVAGKPQEKARTSSGQMPDNVLKMAIELYGKQAGEVEGLLGRVPENWRRN